MLRRFLDRLRDKRATRDTCEHDLSGERFDGMADYAVCVKCGHEELNLE